MSAPTPAIPSNRRSSRSNSISSSVVTVKKSASVSSHAGSRASYLRNRSTSPDSISRVLHSLNSSRSDYPRRPEKGSSGLNINRWSHSTSSSLSAIDSDLIRKRTSSIRRSLGPGFSSNGNVSTSHSHTGSETKFDFRGSPKRSSIKSSSTNRAAPLPGSKLAFNDSSNLKIVQDLAQSSNSSSSADLLGPPWEQGSGTTKFGDSIQSLAIHYTTANANTGHLTDQTYSRMESREQPGGQRMRSSDGRRRAGSTNRSHETLSSSSASPARNESAREKDTRSPKRKDMLSKALSKANQAVLLDNAQNINAAIEAYNEACELLQQVMSRSADVEDKKKLSSIKATYSNRIAELHDQDDSFAGLMDRPLPDDPPSDEYDQPEDFYHEDASYQATAAPNAPILELPLRQESLLPELFGGDNFMHDNSLPPVRNPIRNSTLNVPMDAQYMPQPLSPRPPPGTSSNEQNHTSKPVASASQHQHSTGNLGPSSWLEPFDEPTSKSSSRLSSIDIDRKDGPLFSAIEAEMDAMNAAVDSAYDDDAEEEPTPRITDRTLVFLPVDGGPSRVSQLGRTPSQVNRFDPLRKDYLDDDAEAEERLLDDLNEEYALEETRFSQRTTSGLPRQSDSSGFSGRTWGSSIASTTATTRTTLTTLPETIEPPVHAPPKGALPEPPRSPPKTSISEKGKASSRPNSEKPVGIRDRRMSGQSAQQLKIETFSKGGLASQQTKPLVTEPVVPLSIAEPEEMPPDPPQEIPLRPLVPAASFSSFSSQPLTPLMSIHSGETPQFESPATPALTQAGSIDNINQGPPSPTRQGKMLPPPPGSIMKKNVPSKGNLTINTATADADLPMTPGSAVFPKDSRSQSAGTSAISATSTPNLLTTTASGGMYLFDDLIGETGRPRSTGHTGSEPAPLEPCPESFLLRPFWLMRCLYQALSHPRGAFISTKLFIPRDIWRVRNIKIKALDDKIAQCDFLTAALQKLSKVDTLDANAVLEELQSFETVLDQVRTALSKKLGNDVGLSGSASVFKSSPAVEDSHDSLSSKSSNTSSAAKSIASSWRKLRSKSSSAALAINARNDVSAHNLTISSLPMTSSASVATSRSYRHRNPPPTPSGLPQLLAPHAFYICALARLFDAAQILDNIARQVEDPGLKYSSQTHVGLELSVRNAAEFFAFYIIRFVMSDIHALLDKYMKRGGEWVMA